MANHSQQQNTTSSFVLFSAPECIAWLTVYGLGAVAIVMLNGLTIIVYLKERSLRKHCMYLVINLAVADMFVAGCAVFECSFLGSNCNLWTSINSSNLASVVMNVWFRFIPLASVTNLAAISLERMHATFRPFKHCLLKQKIFGAAVATIWITSGLCSAIGALVVFHSFTIKLSRGFFTLLDFFLVLPSNYTCVLLVNTYKNCLWKSTPTPRCNQ